MIQFEYDIQTSGVRVSFVFREEIQVGPGMGRFEGLTPTGDGGHEAPGTIHNLTCVRKLLDAVIKEEEEA